MFWWILLGVFVLVGYLALRTENDGSGGSVTQFVKASDNTKKVVKEVVGSTVYDTPGRQVLILYGTAYGFSEELGKKLYTQLKSTLDPTLGVQPRLVNMRDFEGYIEFDKETYVMVLCSTAGDGVPPSDARDFFQYVQSSNSSLKHLRISVLALGDSNYAHFCRAGKQIEESLLSLGCKPFVPRRDVDREDWPAIDTWMNDVTQHLSANLNSVPELMDYLSAKSLNSNTGKYSRTSPYDGKIIKKYTLTELGQPEDKEIIHLEIALNDEDMKYTVGDAIGIIPVNNVHEVVRILNAIGRSGKEPIYTPVQASLKEALMSHFDLKTIKYSLLECLMQTSTDSKEKSKLEEILKSGDSKSNSALQTYLHHREVFDVFNDFPRTSKTLTLRNLLAHLRTLQPRYYSISSAGSSKGFASVTVGVIRYSLHGHARTGVCSTFLADRVHVGDEVQVFISSNPDFRLPADGNKHIIMVGPGTGIAPFRAFIQERIASNATGRNRLYFGCRHRARDFTYADEFEQWVKEGHLELRTAFSRDQKEKVYVQHLIEQDAKDIWELIQSGAHFYICGDGLHMANDVTNALLKIFQAQGKMSESKAKEFLANLEKQGRMEKDVWIT